MIHPFEIDEEGDIHCLYRDDLELQDIGEIVNMHRASHVIWDAPLQVFQVVDARTDRIVASGFRKREHAIAWEVEHFSPGGPLYERN